MKRFWMASAVIAVLLLLALMVWRTREPQVSGKPISFWLLQIASAKGTQQRAAIDVLRQSPKPALPHLIRTLGRRDSRLSALYRRLCARAPAAVRQRLPEIADANALRFGAHLALLNLGYMDRRGLKALLRLARDTDADVKVDALSVCESALRPGDTFAVAPLVFALKDDDAPVRRSACYSLACLGPGASNAIPALIEATSDLSASVRVAAAWSLCQISKTNTALAVPVFQSLLAAGDSDIRRWAATYLGVIGAPAQPAIPQLQRLSADLNPEIRIAATEALTRIRESAESLTRESKPAR